MARPALAALALGLRLVALAVVTAAGALLLASPAPRLLLAAGILLSVALGLAQSALARRGRPAAGMLLVPAQVAVWIYLLHLSGGQRSPLFIGLLLEVPLAGTLLGRRGSLLAGVIAIAAYAGYAAWGPAPAQADALALVTGSLGVAVVLSWFLLGILDRQRETIAAARAALSVRAESLATELRLLGDYLGSALLSVDDLGRVASVNQAGVALLGLERSLAVGHPWQEILRPDPATAERLLRTLAGGVSQRDVPLVLHRDDGAPLALRGELWVGPSPGGRRTHLLLDRVSGRETTDDPVYRLGEAAACVAHQIRNSLQALTGLAQQAERSGALGDAALEAGPFRDALRGLSELANDVLAVAGAARPPHEHVPLAHAVSSAVLLARPGAVPVTVAPPAGELSVWAPRGRLVHALYNLIDNACRATRPGAGVLVTMERVGDCAHVEIADGGTGLPPGLDGAHGPLPSRRGSGVGLMAARRFLESGGARLSFAAAPGGGTLCRVTLPMKAGASVPEPLPEQV
jgi:signal transduction histidine kinase